MSNATIAFGETLVFYQQPPAGGLYLTPVITVAVFDPVLASALPSTTQVRNFCNKTPGA